MRSHPFLLAVVLAVVIALPAVSAESKAPPRIEPDVVYGHKDGLAMTMDIIRPEREANGAAILFIVSGGWYSRWSPPEQTKILFQPYLDKGYTLIAVRHGSSPRYSISEAVSDVKQAVCFVRNNAKKLQVDDKRLGVLGMSAGGHLALMLGTTGDDGNPNAKDALGRTSSRVAAVVALVPITDLRIARWDAPESLPVYRRYPGLNLSRQKAEENSPLVHVTPDDAPSLVISGEKDILVPPKHGRWIDEAFECEGVAHKLVILPSAGHGLHGSKNRALTVREALGWFDRHLLGKSE